MTNKKDKPYWKEVLECYVYISLFMILFLGVLMASGQLTGTDWIGYMKELVRAFNTDQLNV